MKKKAKISLILIFLTVIMLGLLYIGLAYYYTDVFPYGTFINGIYVTGMNEEEAAKVMDENYLPDDITITMPAPYDDKEYKISAADISMHYDYLTPLKQYKSRQNPYLWIFNLRSDRHDEIVDPDITFDKETCEKIIDGFEFGFLGAPHTVTLVDDENGYHIYNGKEDAYDPVRCREYIIGRMSAGESEIAVSEDCKVTPAYSRYERELIQAYEKLDEFHKKNIELVLDDQTLKLDDYELDSLLCKGNDSRPILDESGELTFTKESVRDGIYDILSPYNTYNNHDFTTHDGRKVHLTKGTLGNSIDVEPVAEAVYDELVAGNDRISLKPEYKHKMDDKEKNYVADIGNTYIEISLDEQHMYYYENGALKLDTNVVTGKMSTGSGTKEGVYYIYYMQRNRTLVGETYRSFVNYWMAFNRHVGIHDATWRTQWGEDAYLRAGSHGCVNTPFDAAKELYDYAYVGMPVIVYSYEKSEVTE